MTPTRNGPLTDGAYADATLFAKNLRKRRQARNKLGVNGSVGIIDDTHAEYRPRFDSQVLVITGQIPGAGKRVEIPVLMGDGAVTPTGGERWNRIPRPQRKDITVFDGYDPWQLDIPVMFDALSADYGDYIASRQPHAARGVRGSSARALQKHLEQLVGLQNRGSAAPQAARGIPPLVTLSASQNSRPVPLVPSYVDGVYWLLQSITWDGKPARNADGMIVQQLAQLSFMEYVSGPFDTTSLSPAARAKQRAADANKFVSRVMPKGRTLFEFARSVSNNRDTNAAARAIQAANKGRRGVPRDISHTRTTRPVKVLVPRSIDDGASP